MARRTENCLDSFVPYITRAAMVIDARKGEINDLNIFPAPDGDTGTNLANTLAGIVLELSELARRNPNPITDEMYDTVTRAATMHAKGNSGVIFSYIIHGAVGVLRKTKKRFSVLTLKAALEAGKEAAYAGLGAEAKEGTILTVISEMAEAAAMAAKSKLGMAPALEMVVAAGFAAVDKTPEMIDQLMGGKFGKKDAGAHALALMAQGAYEQLIGKAMDMILTPSSTETVYDEIKWREGDPIYHTQMLISGTDIDEAAIRAFLAGVGSSVLCQVDRDIANVHVHTDNPGIVLVEMLKYGELTRVEVDNMKAQAEEFRAKSAASATDAPKEPPKEIGLVVVAAGEGLKFMLSEKLGVDAVVDGGQTANPEVAELVKAIDSVNANSVIVCSSNSNIVMAAREAARLASKPSEVVPTGSVQESVVAVMAYNPEESFPDNVNAMAEAARGVLSGAVTKAISKSKTESGQAVRVGNFIGVSGKRVLAAGKDYLSTVQKLITLLMAEVVEAEIITIYLNNDSKAQEEDLEKWLSSAWEKVDVVVVDGGQPVYDTLIAIE